MAGFEKHRDEEEVYDISFDENRLASGETISSVDDVLVLRKTDTGWEDVTSEFGALGVTTSDSSTNVQFTLNIASSGQQAEGTNYVVWCRVTTSNNRRPVETVPLTILAEGST